MLLGIVRIEPAVPPTDASNRPDRTPWRATGEALAVLAACMAAILVVGAALILVLAPRMETATFDLVAVEGQDALGPAELVARVRALGVTDDVRIEGPAEARRLVLGHLESTDAIGPALHRALREAGYETPPFRVTSWPEADPQVILVEHPALLLGAQSVVFLAFGAVFIALRVPRRIDRLSTAVPRAVAFGAGVGLLGFFASAAIGLIQKAIGLDIQEQAWLVELLREDGIALRLLPWIVILAPCAEEIFFRGYLFRFLNEHAGGRIAFPLSAACFSLIHFNWSGIVVYFVVGLLFAWSCRRTATLAAPIAAHVVYNGVAFGLALVELGR